MTATSLKAKAVENHSYSLGASLLDDDVINQPHKSAAADQDFWGSSMSFDAVHEGRIFGVFGVAKDLSVSRQLAGAMA